MKNLVQFLFLILFSGCVHASGLGSDGFPDIWWQVVPDDQVKGWEIPPHAARRDLGEVVLSKRNELGQFSNLSATPFVLDGIKYASVEGLWQGMKYPESANDERNKPEVTWPYTREQVYAMAGFEAKKAGDIANANMRLLGIKYITYKGEKVFYNAEGKQRHYEIILDASRAKTMQSESLKKLLLSTGNLKFLPDHKQQDNPNPAYLYHEIFMKVRDEVKTSEGK